MLNRKMEYLNELRRNTAYKKCRLLIGFSIYLACGIGLIFGFWPILLIIQMNGGFYSDHPLLVHMIVLSMVAVFAIIATIFKELALLLVDIADSVIEVNSRPQNNSKTDD